MNPLYEIHWYGLWWIPFVALALCLARYLGWYGIVGGVFVFSVTIMVIDVNWIFREMREHPETGRDADAGFWIGVLFRIVLFNVLLLPVSIIGLKLRGRALRQMAHESTAKCCGNQDSEIVK